ncbi:hypothetical protein B4923_10450 [Brenneria roseae subsp. americana]|uniref:Uncharacterized protein n=1 Tax=Brenneria roseae subsp. americana TaxID=1508507 RepID=A0A2U1TSC2_9GAMM|nr:hypothetical protein B4923_10450 [Brenneria roseae subsp. americana]
MKILITDMPKIELERLHDILKMAMFVIASKRFFWLQKAGVRYDCRPCTFMKPLSTAISVITLMTANSNPKTTDLTVYSELNRQKVYLRTCLNICFTILTKLWLMSLNAGLSASGRLRRFSRINGRDR